MDALLRVEHLQKRFDKFALEDINLILEPGYILGLIGVNGSGKSTLIRTILNLYHKDGGDVWIDGHSMELEEQAAKEKIGVVLDSHLFEKKRSVIANAKLYGRFFSKFDEHLFIALCKKYQVPLKKKVGTLSAGFQVRFQLAFALSHDAKLFLFDEPASGLDPLFRKELLGCLQEIVEDGTRSVLMSTHLTEDLDAVADYLVWMKDGKFIFHQSIEEIKERYRMIFGTKEELASLDASGVVYREYGEVHSYALVKMEKNERFAGRKQKIPSLAELMYCLEKGGYGHV